MSSLLHNPNYTQLADSGHRWPLIDKADGHPAYDLVIAEPENHFNVGTENEETVSHLTIWSNTFRESPEHVKNRTKT